MTATLLSGKFSTLKLNTDDILKEIHESEFIRRKEAAKYASKLMKKNISKKGRSTPGGFPARRTGVAKRKVGYQLIKHDKTAKIGSKDWKVHLTEFGHGDGKQGNKYPFVNRSLIEAEPEIVRIMSKGYF